MPTSCFLRCILVLKNFDAHQEVCCESSTFGVHQTVIVYQFFSCRTCFKHSLLWYASRFWLCILTNMLLWINNVVFSWLARVGVVDILCLPCRVPVSGACVPIVALHGKVDERIGEVGAPQASTRGMPRFSVDFLAPIHFESVRGGGGGGSMSDPQPGPFFLWGGGWWGAIMVIPPPPPQFLRVPNSLQMVSRLHL